jgi:predicted nucleotidyltransferase
MRYGDDQAAPRGVISCRISLFFAACYYSYMVQFIAQHAREIDDICRRYRVRRLELFGSAAGDSFDPSRSDVDFLVEFEPLADGEHADAYFGLKESLAALLARPVDLVMTSAIRNRYFLEAIEPTRTLLYAA